MRTNIWNYRVIASFLACLLVGFSSCKDDDPLLAEQDGIADILTSNPWGDPISVQREGQEVGDDYDTFEIEFNADTYRTINGGSAWPASGTWKFVDGKSDEIIRDGDVTIKLIVTENDITLDFNVDEDVFSGARIQTVNAQFTFLLNKLRKAFGA